MQLFLTPLSTEIGSETKGVAFGTPGTLASGEAFTADQIKYYYVTVWLKETGEAQEKVDAGKTTAYTGTVTFNAVGANGTNGVTATFSEGA